LKTEWTARAWRQLREIGRYIAADAGDETAWRVVSRMVATVDLLEANPYLGRQAEYCGRRELVLGQYIVLYSVHRSGVKVVAVTHGAQRKSS
jgi:plasmid stabilization system protein ParE